MVLQSPAAGISRAGANLASQSGQISLRTASNLGNIMMRVAEIKAAGIVEGSRAWQNALQQIGVTARDYPIIKRQMEADDRRREASEYDIGQRPIRERAAQAQVKTGEMNVEAKQKENRDDKLFSDILIESNGDPEKFKTRAKELQRPDMWTRMQGLDRERRTKQANMSTAEANQWTARATAMTSALSPLTEVPKEASAEERRAVWQQSIAEARKINPEFGKDFAEQPNPHDWDKALTAYGMGLTVAEKVALFKKPTLKERLGEEGAAMDHIARVFGRITNDQKWQEALRHAELILPPEYLERIPGAYSPEAVATVKSFVKPATPATGLQMYYEAKRQEPGLTLREYQSRQKETGAITPFQKERLEIDRAYLEIAQDKQGRAGQLTHGQAMAVLNLIEREVQGIKNNLWSSPELRNIPESELRRDVAKQRGYNLDQLQSITGGQGIGGSQLRTMPDGTEWEEATPGRWKRVK